MQSQAITNALTIDEAAKLYHGTALKASAIRRAVRGGEIPSRKIGAKYLITISAIETWLNANNEKGVE